MKWSVFISHNNSMALVLEGTILTERQPLVTKLTANLRIESATWSARQIPNSCNLDFLDQSRYFFFQVAPQLYSRG
jgi:hypothetical protein